MEQTLAKTVKKIMVLPGRPPFMLDRDVAELYETETRIINQAVKRNQDRFPEDFCFQLTEEEIKKVMAIRKGDITDCDIAWRGGHLPYGYAREGCNMLSAVLNTSIAIDRSILIVRAFTAMEREGGLFFGDTPNNTLLPNGWQLHELRVIYGIEGAREILKEIYGIYLGRYKSGISPYEAQVIKKENPNREDRNKQIVELIERGVSHELIAVMSGFYREHISGIYGRYKHKKQKELEALNES